MMTKETNVTVTKEQYKVLEGLKFWLRDLHFLNKYEGYTYSDKVPTKLAIKDKLNKLDSLGVSFMIQNKVLNSDPHDDIIDVLRDNNIKVVD